MTIKKRGFLASIIVFGLILVMGACLDTADDVFTEFAELFRQDTIAINSYVKKKGLKPRIDATGIRFVVTQLGTGLPPRSHNQVQISYEGKLLNDEVFDQGNNITGPVGGFISGFSTALQLLPEGSSAILIIPSVYAYGTSGNGGIPSNASLVFDMALNKVVKAADQNPLFLSDTTTIWNFLRDEGITGTIKDPSGMRYIIFNEGSGVSPGLYDRVKVKYTIKLLSNGQVVSSGISQRAANFDAWVVNYLPGVQIMLRKLKPGGKATLYLTSELGYGPTPFPFIPGNSPLIYELELLEVDPE